jgi:hypothetical protein
MTFITYKVEDFFNILQNTGQITGTADDTVHFPTIPVLVTQNPQTTIVVPAFFRSPPLMRTKTVSSQLKGGS